MPMVAPWLVHAIECDLGEDCTCGVRRLRWVVTTRSGSRWWLELDGDRVALVVACGGGWATMRLVCRRVRLRSWERHVCDRCRPRLFPSMALAGRAAELAWRGLPPVRGRSAQ